MEGIAILHEGHAYVLEGVEHGHYACTMCDLREYCDELDEKYEKGVDDNGPLRLLCMVTEDSVGEHLAFKRKA